MRSTKQIFKFILSGRADVAVKNEWIPRYQLKKQGLANKIIELPTPMNSEPVKFVILISKKSPYHKYLPEIDRYLKQIKAEGSYDKIISKWK